MNCVLYYWLRAVLAGLVAGLSLLVQAGQAGAPVTDSVIALAAAAAVVAAVSVWAPADPWAKASIGFVVATVSSLAGVLTGLADAGLGLSSLGWVDVTTALLSGLLVLVPVAGIGTAQPIRELQVLASRRAA